MEQHLSECGSCCKAMSNVTCDDQLAELARAVHAKRETSEETGQASLAATRIESRSITGTRNSNATPENASLSISQPAAESDIPVELRTHARYRIQRVLGRGGMGVVWLAEHQMMQRLVALKVIGSKFTAGREAVERFQQEVRAAAKLRHSNIVTAFDAEQAGRLHFLVMEYIDGLSLTEHVLQNGPLSIDKALDIIRQTCAGLGYAHRQGMVHRDIKPQNLMLGRDGVVRILDFGLARLAVSDAPVSPTAKTEVRLTGVGMVLGTPDYMSPEQAADAGTVDARTDIYSLGCTLFFLLTGRRPFEGYSFEQMLLSGIRPQIRAIKDFRPDVPAPLIRLIEKMTAENPNDRVQSADDVVRELDAALRPVKDPTSDSSTAPILAPSPKATSDREKKQTTRATPAPSPRRVLHPPAAKVKGSERHSEWDRPARTVWYRRSWRIVAASVAAVAAAGVLIATMNDLFRSTVGTEVTRTASAPSSTAKKDREVESSQLAPRQQDQAGSTLSAKPGNPPTTSVTTQPTTSSAASSQPQYAAKQGRRFSVLFVVPATDIYWPDFGPVRRLLTESGCRVDLASWNSKATVVKPSEPNVPDLPDVPIPLLLTDVNPDDYDALIIGGGPGIVRLTDPCEEADQAESIARQMFASGKVICGLSVGPGVLAKMKLLDGVKATGNTVIHQHVRDNYGVTLSSSSVEVSGQFVTGRDNRPEVVVEFAKAIRQALEARSELP